MKGEDIGSRKNYAYEVKVVTTFAAAHSLRGYPGNCRNIHGHNWKVEIIIRSRNLDKIGMAIDFRAVKEEVEKLLQRFDHSYLNELSPFDNINPTSENLAYWIYNSLAEKLNGEGVNIYRVYVWENEYSSASYGEV